MSAPAPDPDPGFAGMTDWNMDTYFCGAALSDYLKTHEISSPSMGEARWGCIERRFISPSPCPSHQGRGVLR